MVRHVGLICARVIAANLRERGAVPLLSAATRRASCSLLVVTPGPRAWSGAPGSSPVEAAVPRRARDSKQQTPFRVRARARRRRRRRSPLAACALTPPLPNPQEHSINQQAWQTIPGLAAVVICLTAGGFIREGVAHVYWGKPRPGALDPFTKALLARDAGVLEERRQAAEAAEAAAAE
jgi:hypothetical protein